jgi:hypothetical protein
MIIKPGVSEPTRVSARANINTDSPWSNRACAWAGGSSSWAQVGAQSYAGPSANGVKAGSRVI